MFKPNNIDIREEIKELVLKQKNKKYVHGRHGLDSFDCAGLVWYVYNEILGIDLYEIGFGESTTTKMMTSTYGKITLYEDNVLEKDLSLLKTGDILFFHRQDKDEVIPRVDNKYPGHCGIYLGNNKFIHCTRKRGKVIINDLEKSEYWRKKLVGSKDVVTYQKRK